MHNQNIIDINKQIEQLLLAKQSIENDLKSLCDLERTEIETLTQQRNEYILNTQKEIKEFVVELDDIKFNNLNK